MPANVTNALGRVVKGQRDDVTRSDAEVPCLFAALSLFPCVSTEDPMPLLYDVEDIAEALRAAVRAVAAAK